VLKRILAHETVSRLIEAYHGEWRSEG